MSNISQSLVSSFSSISSISDFSNVSSFFTRGSLQKTLKNPISPQKTMKNPISPQKTLKNSMSPEKNKISPQKTLKNPISTQTNRSSEKNSKKKKNWLFRERKKRRLPERLVKSSQMDVKRNWFLRDRNSKSTDEPKNESISDSNSDKKLEKPEKTKKKIENYSNFESISDSNSEKTKATKKIVEESILEQTFESSDSMEDKLSLFQKMGEKDKKQNLKKKKKQNLKKENLKKEKKVEKKEKPISEQAKERKILDVILDLEPDKEKPAFEGVLNRGQAMLEKRQQKMEKAHQHEINEINQFHKKRSIVNDRLYQDYLLKEEYKKKVEPKVVIDKKKQDEAIEKLYTKGILQQELKEKRIHDDFEKIKEKTVLSKQSFNKNDDRNVHMYNYAQYLRNERNRQPKNENFHPTQVKVQAKQATERLYRQGIKNANVEKRRKKSVGSIQMGSDGFGTPGKLEDYSRLPATFFH